MKRELFNKWIEALESGEYKQCKGCLYDGEGYCCLGVLQKMAGISIEEKESKSLDQGFAYKNGIDPLGFVLDLNDDLVSLSTLNDSGTSFKEIAKILKRNPSAYILKLED